MRAAEHQQVINELQTLIDDTQRPLARFEEAGLEDEMLDDYAKLLAILDDAMSRQREHTRAMLGQK